MDAGQIEAVAGQVVPYITAAAAVYGRAVWDRITDEAAEAGADATVTLGQHILRLLRNGGAAPGLAEAIIDIAEHPDDEDFRAVIRAQVKKALAADPGLLADLTAMLPPAGSVVGGPNSTVLAGHANANASTGGIAVGQIAHLNGDLRAGDPGKADASGDPSEPGRSRR